MGLMTDPGKLVIQPHPVLMDGYRELPVDLIPGESLYAFVARYVPDIDAEDYQVSIGGVVVRRELWAHVRPKHGQLIEVRSAVGRSVVALVAMAALMYFTMGGGAIAGFSIGTSTVMGTFAAQAAVYAAGSILINKFLAPKPASPGGLGKVDATHSLNSQRNTFRANEPAGLLFGRVKITPDLATDQAYTFNLGDDQYLAVLLNCGINVDRIDELYQGDALLSSFAGVTTYHSGFSGMTEQVIPLYRNTDTVAGGSLDEPVGTYVQRTSAAGAIRLEFDVEYSISDLTGKGKPKYNSETITIQYRAVGAPDWTSYGTVSLTGSKPEVQRRTFHVVVAEGQYEARVKRNGTDSDGDNAHCSVTWASLRSVQADTTNYDGMALIGIECKATGQLNGSLDLIKGVAYSRALPYWNGSAWATDGTHISNPGAQILKYARGFYDSAGQLIAGMGLSDDKIDLEAIKAFILHCADKGYTYDYLLKDRRNHREVRNAIAAAGFGSTTWSGGKLSVVWAADEQPLEAVVNMATIKKAQFQVDYTFAGMADGIVATYLDASDWTNKEVRINAPGVATALNPASIALEGVTDEAMAAKMARYHLGQSIYQWKSISYATDIEHIAYQRMSLLALQHDLTKWGHGGRIVSAVNNAGTVTLTLDQPVPPPTAGNAYIGLRILGENVYRVFGAAVALEGTTVVLTDPWPTGVAFPGDSDDNAAHDTLWAYDFSTEPGRRVRVVEVQPEANLKGAQVIVAPESDEFWNYVETGEYIPPAAVSTGSTRPVASNVQAIYTSIVQGNTTYGEISVSFDVAGPMSHAAIYARYTDSDGGADGEYHRVADTLSRSGRFRSSGAGTYDIIVRPYSASGVAGGEASTSLAVADPTIPPVDLFTVTQLPGGVRRYAWGYSGSTITPPDLMGVQVRYIAGHALDPAPAWEAMTPLGDVHHGAFESVDPAAGDWTFAVRAVTTGDLSSSPALFEATLAENLGEVIDGIVADHQLTADELAGEILTRAAETQANAQAIADEAATRASETAANAGAIATEAVARADGDTAAIAAAAADAAAKVSASAAVLQAQVDVVQGQVADIYGADVWDDETAYPEGDYVKQSETPPQNLYQAIQDVPAGTPLSDTDYWKYIGNYASLGDAVAGALVLSTTTASELEAVSQTVTDHSARMPSGTGQLATNAQITTLTNAIATGDSALASDVTALQSSIATKDFLAGSGANLLWAEYSRFSTSTVPQNNRSVVTLAMVAEVGSGGGYVLQGTSGGTNPGSDWAYLAATATDYNLPLPAGKYIVSFEAVANVAGHLILPQLKASNGVFYNVYAAGNLALTTTKTRYSGVVTLPAGVTSANLVFYFNRSGVAGRVVKLDRLMIEPQIGSATTPSVWVPGPTNRQVDTATAANAANATAITGLTTRVTAAEGVNTSQATAITNLQSDVAGKASASAVAALTTRVTTAEGAITSTASDVTALENAVNDPGTGLAATSAATASLDTRVTAAEGSISSQGADITALENTVNDPETGVAASATGLSSLTTRVTSAEGEIDTNSTSLLALGTAVGNKADASAVEALETRVTGTEGDIEAISTASTNLQTRVETVESALVNEVITSASKDAAHTASINLLSAGLTDAATGLAAQATATDAIDVRVTTAEGSITSQGSAITSLQNAVNDPVTGLSATAAATNALDTRVTATETAIDAAASDITSLGVEVAGKASSTALSALDVRVTSAEGVNTAQGIAITGLQSDVAGKASASALTTLTTRVTETENTNTSQASAITSIQSTVNHPTTGVAATASAVSAMDTRVDVTEAGLIVAQASYGLSLAVSGKVVGWYALNDGTTGSLIFDMDEVIFENASGSSRIEGGIVVQKAGGYMTVTGPGFGASGDLMKWYGLVRAVNTCTKANAIGYEDTSGHIYYPSATFGDINFDAGSDALTAPQTLQLINNDTNGNPKVVTCTYGFVAAAMVRFDSSAPSGSAVVSLWRKVGTGSFVQLGSTQNITMDASATDYGDDWYYKQVGCSVTFNVTDTDASLSNHTYELRLTSRTISSGLTAELQSMSIHTTE